MAQTKGILERVFKLSEKGTTVKTEILAGLTTFVAMAYIIFVNPSILRTRVSPRKPPLQQPSGPRSSAAPPWPLGQFPVP